MRMAYIPAMNFAQQVIWWTGAIVLIVGGWALVAALGYFALEFTLKLFGVTKLVLQWKWDQMRGRARVTAKKARA